MSRKAQSKAQPKLSKLV